DAEKERIAPVEGEAKQLDGQFQVLTRNVKFQRAERDARRAELDLQVRDGLLGKALRPAQEKFDESQGRVDQMELELQQLQAKFEAASAKLAEMTRPRDDAQAELKKHKTEFDRLEKAKAKIAPSWRKETG